MAKNSVRDFDATAANNTDIQSVDIAENCAPSGINNAIRELMADIKNVSTGTIALESPQADSLTVTGDLTVDTNTLYVDSTNNRVGIGTSSPASGLHVETDTNPVARFSRGSNNTANVNLYYNTTLTGQLGGANAAFQISAVGASTPMQFFANGSERMRIDSSGNVGIGTSSPVSTSKLDVRGRIQVGNSDDVSMASDARGHIRIQGNGYGGAITCDATGMHVYHNASGKSLVFGTNDTERGRFDGSGNLLVGKTSSDFGVTAGSEFYAPSDIQYFTRDGGTPLIVNRLTSDGTIVTFRKDGTTVGSIGVLASNNLYIAGKVSGHAGVAFESNVFVPLNAGSRADNFADLGESTHRFKDLHLGGLAYFGTSDSDPADNSTAAGLTIGQVTGRLLASVTSAETAEFNRGGSDGTVIVIRNSGSFVGSISVSGGTTSYNAFSGSHWGRLADNSKPTILRGTVIESIGTMIEWYQVEFDVDINGETVTKRRNITKPDNVNDGDTFDYVVADSDATPSVPAGTYTGTLRLENDEKHPHVKISDTSESKAIYGVFMDWDNDDDTVNDMYVNAVGTGVIRIKSTETVAIGDLLDSNGDGTAKVQSDDIIRARTIGKVISTVKQETYSDGSYTVPCAIYCG